MPEDNRIQLSETEANKLEHLRKQSKINQEDLAEKSKITLDDYKRLIGTKGKDSTGNRYYQTERYKVENIAKQLGVKPTEFIDPDKWIPNRVKKYRSPFQALIEEKTRRFVGRKVVFNSFNQFVEKNNQGYFILKGDPGEGKSSILSYYIKEISKYNCIYYFNIYSDSNNRASQFLENICNQLIEFYNLEPKLSPNAFEDGNFLKELLEQISKKLAKTQENLIICIDALDEANLDSQQDGTNYLYLPRYLPENIYFFLTTRRNIKQGRLIFETPTRIIDLKDYQMESIEDIKKYIELFLNDEDFKNDLNQWIIEHNLNKTDFINQLTEKSKSEIGSPNFMYLRYVLPQIAQGYYQNLDTIEDLPLGLESYYFDHWHRMNMTDLKIKIIYILTVIRRPVTRSLLSKLVSSDKIKVNQQQVQVVLDQWKDFLVENIIEGEKCYKVYHASFNDFLRRQEMVQAIGIEIDSIHNLIADGLWKMIDSEE